MPSYSLVTTRACNWYDPLYFFLTTCMCFVNFSLYRLLENTALYRGILVSKKSYGQLWCLLEGGVLLVTRSCARTMLACIITLVSGAVKMVQIQSGFQCLMICMWKLKTFSALLLHCHTELVQHILVCSFFLSVKFKMNIYIYFHRNFRLWQIVTSHMVHFLCTLYKTVFFWHF